MQVRLRALRIACPAAAALVAAAALTASAAPQPVQFRLAPKPGDTFEARLHHVRKSVQWSDYKGVVSEKQEEVGSTDVTVAYRVRVVSIHANAIEVEIEFTSSAGTTMTTEGPYAWDSAKKTPLPTTWYQSRKVVTVAALGGVKATATLDAGGRVVKTKGLREAFDAALRPIVLPAHAPPWSPTDEDLAATIQRYLPPPPQGTWTVGTPQEREVALTWAGTDSRFAVRQTLQAPAEGEARIDQTWTYRPRDDLHETTRSQITKDEGTGRATSVWSRSDGWLLRRDVAVEHHLATKWGRRLDATFTESFERTPFPAPTPPKRK